MKNFYLTVISALCVLSSFIAKAQTPILNSYPSASATIFLDFDGQTVNGTSWNCNGPIFAGPSNLSSTQITEIFNRIAEDYRPFNINVTTDSTKYFAAPTTKRMRVIFTITSDWYGAAGGVSYTNSFTWGDNTPAWVFTALLNYNTKNIAEAGAHEVGHTLGLRHQSMYDANCNKISDYNTGTGSGEIGWAPIMGAGYYQNFTLWNNGANPYGCTNFQDDLSIITSTTNGFGYRTDDYGNTASNQSTVLAFNNSQFSINGVIEKSTDVDVFKFTMPSFARFTLNAIPYAPLTSNNGADLDIQVDLLDRNGNLIRSYNPPTTLNAVIDTNLDAANYYIRVQGAGNTYASKYASLGSYTLQGNLRTTPLPLHRLELRGANENNRHSFTWIIDADENVVKQTLEASTDGRNFSPITDANVDARTFAYVPTRSGSLYYRLNVLFDNGRQYYSNTVGLRVASNNKPYLTTNTIYNNVNVNSPIACNYIITDLSGKQIVQGKISQGANNINTGFITAGMYVIRFTDGQDQYVEKFVKN
ncbi:MAG: hypothetical protein C4330_00675 [Chitinophagaceae bacterium]